MKYLKAAVVCALASGLSVAVVLFIAVKLWGNVPNEDHRGFTPKSLLTHFLEECRANDIDSAIKLWTPESLERFPEIREWCQELGELELEYGEAKHGKYDTIVVIVADGEKNGEPVWRHFYFEIRDSIWHLHWHNTKIEQDSSGNG